MKKVVIIGANDFQNPLILKAKELGYETHVFAWKDGSIGEKTADYFYPISIVEKDKILEECKIKAVWNKERAMGELIDLLDVNKKENLRYEEAFYDELDLIDKKIEELERQMKKPRIAKKLLKQIEKDVDAWKWQRIQVCKRHISNKNVNEAILSSIQQLNEIMDFKNEALRNLKESENQSKVEIIFNTDMEKADERNTTKD